MSYQALYRVWRPQRFDEIVGQSIITRTFKNALITKQISHAYLFTGPRGTGKTSAAKIFAKAVNCHFLKDGEPCNECETCKAINEGSLNDVIEIDAASNNGVEEIRDIRDKAKYAPTQADYKVYIIDEVHMLSTGAFNALLKTLEEPPTNVIFILATTEPHKIPATIISRTQKFDFKRIKPQDILSRMEYILDQKKVAYDDKALKLIAKAAEGGMRDALSILDQAMSYGDNQITYENALLVTGSVTNELLTTYMQQVVAKDTKSALITIQKILDEGKDASRFIEDLTSYCQDILLYQQDPGIVEEMELGVIDDQFKELSQKITDQEIYQMISELNAISNSLRYTANPDVYLEVLTVKITHLEQPKSTSSAPAAVHSTNQQAPSPETTVEIQQLTQEVDRLKAEVESLKQQAGSTVETPAVSEPAKASAPALDTHIELAKIYPILGQATRKQLNQFKEIWPDLMNALSVTQRAVMHVSSPVAASEGGVIVAFEYPFVYQKAQGDSDLKDALENNLDRIVGKVPQIVFVPENQWPEIRHDYLANHRNQLKGKKAGSNDADPKPDSTDDADERPADDAETQPVVKKAEELFGKDILDIKND
ncbi:DNA polymerase III subunit tau [Lentilactobacillus parabuchneri]|jgi:DNA polymerase-3 subunit gamma/tau|uniref:DNA-directed DNA polymerase n=2 Tax=Lentilactobacillus parabuchneri TaxID=152331 RepID=A0A0R1YXC6_9LACO|nr:DNA polymerase III subunit gamma/tau [Lentilactobacillus parabuchneri]APR08146.1 DNA polymerase III subunit tau [Lentilactobacillus parabuchneri]KRM46661.1 DNA polymerase III subunits gamma and tau [Lentilactobacillus parabuchneri DSM 5707 = NBRC 107865]KRN76434.1 DNA polymerase III subunits gamma and tau [Lentilactobacillus parabuchneri]MBW0222403.1 DNA polymerase III subunit gamma/tau [Lentilactobacillus parabuchneri]MBW0244588.1 DNA polymerase III subunit gamma/tau [Lentilactobacillus pa